MDILTAILIVFGLCLFETVNSIDNAIINAEVLSRVNKKTRRLFLTWGLLVAVFLVRGVLPWLLVWLAVPVLGAAGAFTHAFSNDPSISEAIDSSSPMLLIATGTFLLCLFLHWFFKERKRERGLDFSLSVIMILSIIIYLALNIHTNMVIGALVGCVAFFVMQGVKDHADRKKQHLKKKNITDYSKIFYLEMIDASFSVDGVLGAFAFTLSVPLIIIGNGLGALIVRNLTLKNIEHIKKYRLMKNGAMYSIAMLSILLLLDSFGIDIPRWLAPVLTFAIVGFFFVKTHRAVKAQANGKQHATP